MRKLALLIAVVILMALSMSATIRSLTPALVAGTHCRPDRIPLRAHRTIITSVTQFPIVEILL